ncbi:hypothetical protein Tco_1227477 [Tanacetum coccineum]
MEGTPVMESKMYYKSFDPLKGTPERGYIFISVPGVHRGDPTCNGQGEPKVPKDYKAEYKKMKAKLALLEANEEEVSDDEEKTQVKVLMDLAADELSVGNNHACNGEWIDIVMKKANTKPKKKILGDEQLTESSSQNDGKENPFITVSLDYDYEMVQKSKDWVERLNPDSKLPNFNTGRILQAVNECL